MFRKSFTSAVALALVVSALSVNNSPAAAQTFKLETVKCAAELQIPADVEGKNVVCSTLVVPQDYQNPGDGKTFKLSLITAQTTENNNPPVVFLAGGPGQGSAAILSVILSGQAALSSLIADRTMIFLDQRGTGSSEPKGDCPELQEATTQFGDLSLTEEARRISQDATRVCYDRLTKEGYNFGVVNGRQNAADVDALRQALGVEKVDLYGVSYGSRLALTIMRDFPEAVRAAVIASPYPPEADLASGIGEAFDNAVQTLFDDCAADTACNQNFPDLRAWLDKAYNALKAAPAAIKVTVPGTETPVDIELTADLMINGLYTLIFVAPGVVPAAVHTATEGNYEAIGAGVGFGLAISGGISQGMSLSTNCADEFNFSSIDQVRTANQDLLPALQTYITGTVEVSLDQCSVWKVNPSDALENQPVTSNVPTLIISGRYDPITPPSYGELAAKGLSSSYGITIDNAAHDPATGNECAVSIMQAFYTDPTKQPDTSCTETLKLEFVTPENSGSGEATAESTGDAAESTAVATAEATEAQ